MTISKIILSGEEFVLSFLSVLYRTFENVMETSRNELKTALDIKGTEINALLYFELTYLYIKIYINGFLLKLEDLL
jgi:hypothetical protein